MMIEAAGSHYKFNSIKVIIIIEINLGNGEIKS